jgi:hypothetical protein
MTKKSKPTVREGRDPSQAWAERLIGTAALSRQPGVGFAHQHGYEPSDLAICSVMVSTMVG